MSAGEKRFGLYGAKPLAGRAGVQVVRVEPPVRTAWIAATARRPGSSRPAHLRVYGSSRTGRPGREIAVDVVPSPQTPAATAPG